MAIPIAALIGAAGTASNIMGQNSGGVQRSDLTAKRAYFQQLLEALRGNSMPGPSRPKNPATIMQGQDGGGLAGLLNLLKGNSGNNNFSNQSDFFTQNPNEYYSLYGGY